MRLDLPISLAIEIRSIAFFARDENVSASDKKGGWTIGYGACTTLATSPYHSTDVRYTTDCSYSPVVPCQIFTGYKIDFLEEVTHLLRVLKADLNTATEMAVNANKTRRTA